MEVKEFIANLNRSNFSLSVDNGKLNLTGDRKKLSKEEIDGIKSNKEVIDYIKANKNEIIDHITLYSNLSSVKRLKNISSVYRLSGLQQGMLFHGLYEEETEAYKIQFKCDFIGLNEKAFTGSWNYLLRRHTILRTGFYYDAFNVPVQCVYNDVQLPVEILDFSSMNEGEKAAAVKEYAAADLRKSFDFKTPPLMRVGLMRLSDKVHRMQWTSHHILFDGWSLPILMEEFLSTYELLIAGKELEAVTEDKYEDYIRYIDRSDKNKEEAHWRNYLKEVEQSTLLPFVETTTERTKGIGSYRVLHFNIDTPATLAIQNFAQANRLTVNTIIQGVWSLLLHRYTGSDHVVFGAVVSGRPEDLPGVEKRVGMFINTLPLHSALPGGDQQVIDWLQNLQNEQILSRQYQHTPLSDIQQWVGVQGDLFDSLLVFENYPVSKIVKSNRWSVGIKNVSVHDPTNYPLTILVNSAEQLNIHFNYNTKLLNSEYVQAIRGHFEHVLLQITNGVNSRLSDIRLLIPAEEKMLLQTFNDTAVTYPDNKTVVDLFEEQAFKKPEAIAIVFEQQQLTYSALNEQSNQLAYYLQSRGVKEETLVPICMERSVEMLIGLMGILKAGGAYLPIDPAYPAERIKYMLEDTGSELVVSNQTSRTQLPDDYKGVIIDLDVEQDKIAAQPSGNLQVGVKASHLAYVIYTSGSTGKPKGVMIEHGSIVNLLKSISGEVGFNDDCSVLSVTTYSFDICYLEFYMPLTNGGKLIIVPRETAMDGFRLAERIAFHHPTHMQGTPSTWQLLLDSGWENQEKVKVLIGGEAVKEGIKEKLTAISSVWNVYGPTETTIWSTIKKLEHGEQVTIGKPIANTQIYILNNHQPSPVGVSGELYIGGSGLARGYLNRPELTTEKFIKNPFSKETGARLYRTGDLARWLADGNIQYLRRIDEQVKIRGYRIELGEIESALRQSNLMQQTVVVAKEDKENTTRLVGYYVPDWKVVKLREAALYQDQVANWKEVYDTEYAQPGEDIKDEEFDIGIWNDSFTGKPIPPEQMKEWVDDIVEVILSENTGGVLEIGCGTGLIYYRLAGKVQRYIGTDFSQASINLINNRISKGLKDYGPTKLQVCAAHEIALGEEDQVDTIILNSVVQYFPGEAYMDDVIAKSISLLKSGGRIIIGDVRDKRLLELFKGRLQLQKLQGSVSKREFEWGVAQEVLKEEELCFSPDYFYDLQSRYPRIMHVDVQWKHSTYTNELTLYRYTVVIYVDIIKAIIAPVLQPWNSIVEQPQQSISLFSQHHPVIMLQDAPSPRLWQERQLKRALDTSSVSTVSGLSAAINKEDNAHKQMAVLLEIACSKGYQYRLLSDEDPLLVNVLLELEPLQGFIGNRYNETGYRNSSLYTNIPLFESIALLMQKDIRLTLSKKLPEYMVPSEFVALSKLPLTANGKVDRLFLSQWENKPAYAGKFDYQPPTNNLEQKLVAIWQELLGIEKVGINNNFFEIGGHSLLAMRVISLVRRRLETEIGIKDLFTHPTIAELAHYIRLQSGESLLPQIIVHPRPQHIPLSFSQERLWFVDRYEGSVQYHLPAVLKLNGNLNVEALQHAFQNTVARHEVLRTVIRDQDGAGYQVVQDAGKWKLNIINRDDVNADSEGLFQAIQDIVTNPFNLSADYMLRASLIMVEEQKYVLVVVMHHIASDGWSLSVLVKEVVELYEAFTEKRSVQLSALPVQYADYAIWQRAYLQGEVWDAKIAYWKSKLEGVAALELPTDFTRPAVQEVQGASIYFSIDATLTQQINNLSRQQGTTLFMTLLAAFKTLLYRYTGQPDICVGTPIANRTQQEVENLIGFFVNTLALRSPISGKLSLTQLLQSIKETTLEAYTHQEVPFEKVMDAVIKQRNLSRSPLVQVMFSVQNTPELPALRLGDVELINEPVTISSSKFDISFLLTEAKGQLHGSVVYSTALYREETISRLVNHYTHLLRSIVAAPDQNIAGLPMLDAVEKNTLLSRFNDTLIARSAEDNIVALLQQQAIKTPEALALQWGKKSLTYQQLHQCSNQLAHYLRAKGVTENVLVPICAEKGFEMIIGIIGILKAGGAYVPVDPAYPAERIRFMLADTTAPLMLVAGATIAQPVITVTNVEIINLNTQWTEIEAYPDSAPNVRIQFGHLAYVLYTSGSTGRPKGVQVPHSALSNHLLWFNQQYLITEKDSSLLLSSFSFDGSMTSLWPVLLKGGTLHLPEQNGLDADEVLHYIETNNITYLKTLPGVFKAIVQQGTAYAPVSSSVRLVIVGGEKINVATFKKYRHQYPYIVFANHYGPTECTISSSYYIVDAHNTDDYTTQSIIGRPVSNTRIYVLGDENSLCPTGVPGEIAIGGACVATGYLNRPELTAEKFIPDLFSPVPGATLYKTGDTGRWLPDGNLEYIGRKDSQVKIRGYRIELSEIEAVLQQSGFVSNVAIVAREDAAGDTRLIGYIIAGQQFNRAAIIAYLKAQLPDYMVPLVWVNLEQFPLTPNGKTDKAAFPEPEIASTIASSEPQTATEIQLTTIWKTLLRKETIGTQDNFFEAGGHSLLAMQVISLIRKEMEVEVAIRDLFVHPTIAGLAAHIDTQTKVTLLPKIEAQPRPEYIPLSFSQERMWFVHQLSGSVSFHLPTVLKLSSKLHVDALHHALQQVVNRHQILRTVILEKDGRGYQLVLPENELQLPVTDGAAWVNDPVGLQAYIQQSVNVPFNIGTDHMLRTELVRLGEQEHVLISVMHHIASDKWSTLIFIQEVVERYESYVQQRAPVLAPLSLQYADYAIWQRTYLQGEQLQQKLDYWKKKLSSIEPLELPADYTRPAVQSGKGAIKTFHLSSQLSAKLKTLSYRQQSTLFMTLLAAFKVLLYRYSGQADICVGTSIAGRQQHEIENLIGLFVNILALRTQVGEDETFTSLLQHVKQTTLEAYQHQEVPFEKVVDAVAGERDRSRTPVFQIMLVMLNTPEVSKVAVEGLTLSGLGYAYAASKYDLTFFVTEKPEDLTLSVEYSTDLFKEQTIDRMVAHFDQLLQSIVANPNESVARLPIISQAEQQLLVEVNQTATGYPAQASIVSLFEQQVQQRGAATAILFEDNRLSYTELNIQANRLAYLLREHGVGQEMLVPICLEKGINMMVSILAILKAGGAYVPIDPQYPQHRIHFMLQDVGATVVITNTQNSISLISAPNICIINLDSSRDAIAAQPGGNLSMPVLPHHLAYVIYTSGSTGQPKGVLATHGNVVSLITGVQYVSLSPNNVLLSTGAPTFDATTVEYWGMLLNGGQLVLCSENTLLNTTLLQNEIDHHAVNIMWFTASWFNQLVETAVTIFRTLETVLVGGEKLSEKHISKLRQQYPALHIINGYGPTENTTFSLTYSIAEATFDAAIPIGKPLSNRTAYVLDQQQQLCPVGVAGEICVGGAGVTRGYLNQPELTAAKFIPDPFTTEKSARLYRTGDRGRYLPDGNLEYIGRIDNQVKIRGYRIEPGEIEAVLRESPQVQQAVVTVHVNAEGTKRLIAYVVPATDFDKQAVGWHLQDKLPDYMIPSLLVEIDALPLTANGKIDRNALPDLNENDVLAGDYIAPRNPTEQVLASIWQTLLDVEQIGINDNFFERGGDSLLAIRVISAIRKELGAEVAISSLFEHQTIATLASHLQVITKTAVLPSIVPAPRPAHIPLSFSQQRLWFIDRLEGSIQYHITTALRLKGQLNLPALQHAFSSIINRHEVLRTVFRDENGEAWQTVKEAANWVLPVIDGVAWQQNVQGLQQPIQQLIHAPFHLGSDNMLRAHLIMLSAEESLLIITLHHIASDGWSASILVKEIGEYYAAYAEGRPPVLPLLPIQYADFAIWQQSYLTGSVLDEKLTYWVQKLQGVTPIQLPADFVRPAIQTTRGGSKVFSFDEQTTTALKQLSQQHGSTLFMTLLTALKVMLYRYTGSQDICVGTATAGRQQQEVEGLIGFFINTLALRSAVQADDTFTDLLSQVKRTTLEAYKHQDVPFEKVVDAVTTKRDRSRNPIIQVMFVLQNTPEIPCLQFGDVQFVSEPYEHTTSQFELSFSIIEQAGGLSGSLVYNADLYAPETMNRLLVHFQQLVQSILQGPDKKISRLNFLSEAEQRQLIEFNNTTIDFPQNKTVVDLITEQVEKTPHQIALIDEKDEITYQELNQRSNQLARYLQQQGIGAGKLVPVCMNRSTELVVSLLAILKTGAAYVPIDPAYPAERISYMLQDIDAALLLSNTSGLAAVGALQNVEIISVDAGWPMIANQPVTNLETVPTLNDLAYVIYTSGSTGWPKGVMIEHAGLANLIYWHHGAYRVTAASKATAMAGVGFDAFGWEIWPYLTAGASVRLISNEQRLVATQLLQVFSEISITHSFVPTALVPELIDATRHKLLSLQYLLTGGDKLNLVNMDGISYALINNYGPTENTVVATSYPVGQKDTTYPIGKPVANTRIYIIDPQNNLTGIGIPGEICISGASLSRGYLHQPQFTAEKFIDNPFEQNGCRLYKTGDWGRWLPDGNIEYSGRMDEQVKILGNRIELGEIETVLQQSGLVQQAVVLVREDANGTKQLIAYVVAHPFDREAIIAHLKTMLPAYMVPAVWVPLHSLPLTANGKIDKQHLPDADAGALVLGNYVAPRNATEVALAQIWQDLLRIERAGVEDNFFELGGHSLLVMRLIAAINQQMGVELSVKDVFEFSTISELSKYLEVQLSLAPDQNNTDDFDLLVI